MTPAPDHGLTWYKQKPMLHDIEYARRPPLERLAIRELRDLAALQSPEGIPASVDDLEFLLRGVPKDAIAAVVEDWFPLNLQTGTRFDNALDADLRRVEEIREVKRKAGLASAARRREQGQAQSSGKPKERTIRSPDNIPPSTRVEQTLPNRQHMFNRTDGRTDGRTKEEAAPVAAASLEASPPTGELPTEWSQTKARLEAERRSRGFPRASNGSGSLDSGQT